MLNIASRRTPLRRAVQASVAVVVVAATVSIVDSPASAASEKVLQSVAISLGSDSSIRSISSTAVRAGEGDELSTDDTELDPTDYAGELPVRVLTTWRLGDRSGTDLSEIEGESGRVVIDVTVQNTTARPEQVSYDFDGEQRTQNALVGAPMTVVASADLGEESLGSVVTRDDVNPDDVTNGVVGSRGNRAGTVQWAALLAPPRLAASASFRLVQDTDDFQVPDLDLSVQPGLVTDPSVQGLLDAAFSEDPGSTLELESATIELVSNVNSTLTAASSVLGDIQGALGTAASELGQKTIGDLQSSSALVSSSLTSLAGDLESLNTQMAGEMRTASSDTVDQFEETIASMSALLGDPARFDSLPTVESVACGDDLPRLRTAGSITEQMLAISAQLRTILTATEDCKLEITQGLNEAIGETTDGPEAGTVIGSLAATQQQLQADAAQLEVAGQELADGFDGDLLGYLSTSIGSLGTLVENIQSIADDLRGAVGGGNQRELEELQNLLGTLETQLTADEAGLRAIFGDIHASAGEALAAFEGDANVVLQVQAARDAVCELAEPGTDNEVDTGGHHDVSALLVGQDCDGDPLADGPVGGFQDDLLARLTTTTAALSSIQEWSDTTGGATAEAFGGLTGAVDDSRAIVDELLADTGETGPRIDRLLAAITELSDGRKPNFDPDDTEWPNFHMEVDDGAAEPPEQCAVVQAFVLPPKLPEAEQGNNYVWPDHLEMMRMFHKKMQCNQFGIEDKINAAFLEGADLLRASDEVLDEHIDEIDRARLDAEGQVDQMVDTLSSALQESATAIRTDGRRSVSTQQRELTARQQQLASSLDQRVTEAVRRVEATVSDSTRNLRSSERALLADLNEVLLDLGTRDRNGSGLLGALVKGAADTGTATDSVIRAGRAASEFAGVRSTALEDVFLQQAQLARSLELLETFPVLGIDLPEGSSHLTVFTYELGEN